MKKDTLLIASIFVIGLSTAFCLIVGPLVWYNASSHFSKFEEIKKHGTKTTGTIQTKRKTDGLLFIPGDYYVDIIFEKSNGDFESIDDLIVTAPAWKSFIYGETVVLYYKNEGKKSSYVVIGRVYDKNYLGFMYNPLYGKLMTSGAFFVVLLLFFWLIYIRKKTKPKPYIRPKDF